MTRFALPFASFVLLAVGACAPGSDEDDAPTPSPSPSAAEASVTQTPFGTTPDGAPVRLFTLTNANGIELRAITYGGIIVSLKVPDRDGVLGDIVLGYDDLDGYLGDTPYFGALVGRYGNRIAQRGPLVRLEPGQ